MKKIVALFMLFVCMFTFSACNNSSDKNSDSSENYTEEELREKFPEYFDLEVFKGIEVYVWQMAEDSYRCGALSGTDRIKFPEEITSLSHNSASIEEMKAILSFYGYS